MYRSVWMQERKYLDFTKVREQAEGWQTAQVDFQHWCGKFNEICIRSKNTYEYSWNNLYSSPKRYGIGQTGDQK